MLSPQVAEHRHGQVCGGVDGAGAGRLPQRAARHLRRDALQGAPRPRDVQGELDQSFWCVNDVITGQSVAAMGLYDAQIHTDRHREVRPASTRRGSQETLKF